MKKRIAFLLTATLLLSALTGCGGGTEEAASGAIINKAYSEKSMTTVAGEAVDVANSTFAFGATAYGYAMVYPQSWKEIPERNLYLARDEGVCVANYVPQGVVDQLTAMADSEMTDEEIAQVNALLSTSMVPFATLYAVNEGGKKPTLGADYQKSVDIATVNGYVYTLAYNTKLESDGLSDVDKANLEILAKSVDEMQQNVLLFLPQEVKDADFAGNLSKFSAKDMNGKAVDQSVLADYDLTMVNIWSTWCGYCIDEMDELQALYEQLPDNVNMITICADANEEKALAQRILDDNGATFTTLVGNESLQKALLQYVSGYPTTVFVDGSGQVVGDIQQGAPGRDVLAGYQSLIDARLSLVGNDEGAEAWLKK